MKKPSPPMPASMRKADSFIAAGGSTPTEKAQAKVDNGMTAFTLRLYQSKLDKLSTLKEVRKQARLVEENPSRETISVNSLILEAIDMLLKQEAKRAVKNSSKKLVKMLPKVAAIMISNLIS